MRLVKLALSNLKLLCYSIVVEMDDDYEHVDDVSKLVESTPRSSVVNGKPSFSNSPRLPPRVPSAVKLSLAGTTEQPATSPSQLQPPPVADIHSHHDVVDTGCVYSHNQWGYHGGSPTAIQT